MQYSFESIDDFLTSIETDIINVLFDYKLLDKFDRNVKKIIFHFFVRKFGERINLNKDLLFFHSRSFQDSHELFKYYDKEKLTVFLNKICVKLKKLTKRILFLNQETILPNNAFINDLEGNVVDEILLLKAKDTVDLKKLKSFLDENSLTELFCSLSKKVS
jgi:hypothetical protein